MDQTSLSEYNSLLKRSRICKDDRETEITHTLMGGFRGKYHISNKDYERFIKLYRKVYKYNNQHVVERPTKTSFLFIDVDWHHKEGYTDRQYTYENIKDIITETNKILLKYFNIQQYHLKSFIHEKDSPTCEIKNYKKKGTEKKYKDGFHIFYPDVPLSFEHRYFVINKLSEACKKKNIFDYENLYNFNTLFPTLS